MDKVLQQQITAFTFHEETPVQLVVGDYPIEAVFTELGNLLNSTDPQTIVHTLGFIRDAGLYPHPRRDAFNEHLQSSAIWENFRKLLLGPSFNVRRNTIYTIGKLTHRNRASLLEEMFPFYSEKDPLILPSLIQELLWLTNEWNWEFLEKMTKGDHYLQRWSACALLDDRGDNVDIAERFVSLLSPLTSDSHPCVAAEANFRLERIKVKLGPKLAKAQWRVEVNRIAQLRPRMTFKIAVCQFMRERDDYDIAEFDRFLAESPAK